MESPEAYIPIDRRLAIARGENLSDRTDGAALFADISGFTPLTEALVGALGPLRGAEELPAQLNRVYDALIAEVDQYGGSVLGFSGDAITCWFDHDDGLRATACALAMQQAMEQFTAIPIPDGSTVTLAIKVAVATGTARRFLVGDPDIQVIDVLAGGTLDNLAGAEHMAGKGEVVLDLQASCALRDHVAIAEWRTDAETGEQFAVISGLARPVAPAPWPTLAPLFLSDEQTCSWLLPPVHERLRSGLGEFLTELRPAVALFLRFGGIDYDTDSEAGTKLDDYIRWVQHILARYGAFMLQLTIGDKGSYLYAAFGAPLAHEDDAIRAVAAALELRVPPAELDFIQNPQIGISHGRMRTGAYGGITRRTYGVLGDHVNLAARLMQNAPPGEVLVSHVAQKQAANAFTWKSLPPLRVKGKSEPITVFRAIAAKDRQALRLQEPRYALPMVGRKDELALVEQKLELALSGKGQIIAITAEAGMGKSRLLAEIIRRASERDVLAFGGECQSYGTNNSYLVWESIWCQFFNLDQNAPLDNQTQALEQVLEAVDPMLVPRMPLLGMVLNLPIPDNDLTRSLDAKLRKGSLEALLVDCLRARAKSAPLFLVLEDCHWIDPLSDDLLEAVGRAIADLPVLIVIAYRPPDVERIQGPRVTQMPHCTVVPLHDFTEDEAVRLIGLKLAQLSGDGAEPPLELVQRITERAQGNPFYIEELLNYLRDQGLDPHDAKALGRLDLPTNLHSLILSRIDQLTESQKLTVKVASIIGRLFRLSWLWGVHPELGQQERVLADLDALSRLDLTPLDQPEPEFTYLFKHIITREVAYESLPFAIREVLHEHLGQFIEQRYSDALDQYVDLLAYHYDHSQNLPKKCEYLRKAGEAARTTYANQAAIDYYRRLMPLLEESEQMDIALKMGQVLGLVGQYEAALEYLQGALRISTMVGNLDMQAQSCRWIARAYENRGEYDTALEWIQRGLNALQNRETSAANELLVIAGLIHTRQGHYEEALKKGERSRQIAEHLGDMAALAFSYHLIGHTARVRGNSDDAVQYFRRSLDLYYQIGNIHGQGQSHNNIANAYFIMGKFADAEHHYQRAREIFNQSGDIYHLVFADNNLGEIARNQGRLDDALAYYEEALHSLKQIGGSPWALGTLHMNLGAAYIQRRDVEAARKHLATSRKHFEQGKSRDFLPELHRHFAAASLLVKDLPEAQRQAEQALALARELSMRGEEGSSMRVLGEVAIAQAQFPLAEKLLDESLGILSEIKDQHGVGLAMLALAKSYLLTDRTEQGLSLVDQSIAIFDGLGAYGDLALARSLRDTLTVSKEQLRLDNR